MALRTRAAGPWHVVLDRNTRIAGTEAVASSTRNGQGRLAGGCRRQPNPGVHSKTPQASSLADCASRARVLPNKLSPQPTPPRCSPVRSGTWS
ncbi:hypothetical protein TgHK011_002688 [Trichoderma gracile]|nr:hypothetical protein TgHK011_002688 [Trichoderma gracile]